MLFFVILLFFIVLLAVDFFFQFYGTCYIYRKYAGYSLDKRGFAMRKVYIFVFCYNCGILFCGLVVYLVGVYYLDIIFIYFVIIICIVLIFINVLSIMLLDPMIHSNPTPDERYFLSKGYIEFSQICISTEDRVIELNKMRVSKAEKRFQEFCRSEGLKKN